MANLKNITELPVAESAEGLNLIVNDNGSAKQIAASAVGAQADFAITDETNPGFIKNKPEVAQADWSVTDESSPAFINNKPHRELVYEWNFEADSDPDSCVYEVMENLDEDVSWLTSVSEDIGWEIEVSQYALYEDMESGRNIVNPDVYTTVFANNKGYFTRIQNDTHMCVWMAGEYPQDYMNDWSKVYCNLVACIYIYNKVFFDDNWNVTEVDNGGRVEAIIDEGGPFKSIKIYKVYR